VAAYSKEDSNSWREILGFDPASGICRTYVAFILVLLGYKLKRTSGHACLNHIKNYWK
jgi:hypothetical protein